MQSFGGQHMGFDALEDWLHHGADRTHLVGQGGQTQGHALLGVALGLAVQRLVLAELLEGDHRQKSRPGPAARDYMERRGGLADLLAVPAGELLAHVLDHLPLARDHLQRLGDVLAKLGQSRAAAAEAGVRPRHDDPFAGQVFGERLAGRPFARERRHCRGPGRGYLGSDLVGGSRGL